MGDPVIDDALSRLAGEPVWVYDEATEAAEVRIHAERAASIDEIMEAVAHICQWVTLSDIEAITRSAVLRDLTNARSKLDLAKRGFAPPSGSSPSHHGAHNTTRAVRL